MISIYLKHQQKQFLKLRKPQEFLQSFSLSFLLDLFLNHPCWEWHSLKSPVSEALEGRWRKGGGLEPWEGVSAGGEGRDLAHLFPSPPLTWWGQRYPSHVGLNITQRLPDPSGLGDYLPCSFFFRFYCVECGREISHYLKPSPDLDPDCQFIHYHVSCI